MLISYPLLPADAADQSETARFNAMLERMQRDRGLYPVTTGNRWHGGIHLSPGEEPIRAIADGVIVAYRLAPDTLEYSGHGRFDTSFVLIRHETETGENTRIVFYSLYMHLRPKGLLTNAQREQLTSFLRNAVPSADAVQAPANTRIWRKEVLGFGGQLYGHPTVHFEIFATETDFAAFWRDRGAIAAGNHGSEDVFGDMHFVIPANQQFAERHPRAIAPHKIDLPGANQFFDLELGQAGQNNDRLHVVVQLETGNRIATTFRLDDQGRINGQVGDPVRQDNYEYELYRLATALYPDCPSAGFEYLRFGRLLGPDTTHQVENWQLIRYTDTQTGYINLADPAHRISVLSDADFPMHWQKLEEGDAASPNDGIANVARLTELLQLPATPSAASLSAPADFATRATDTDVAEKLRHFICKHPSEWDGSNLETRYAALRQPGKPLQGDTAWKDFKEHVEAMTFWARTGLSNNTIWHFHPLQFIRHYRQCGWRSQRELLQLVPQNIIRKPGSHNSASLGHWESPAIGPASTLLDTHATELNNALRKFCIDKPVRQACFFGNAVQETQWFRYLRESNGTQPTLHLGWYGRGFLQLTNPNGNINNGNNNYYRYFEFLGRRPMSPPGAQETTWRDQIATNARHAAHSAGAYWVWPNKSAPTQQNPNRPQVDSANKYADISATNVRRTIATVGIGTKTWYYNQSFTNCCAAVNYPGTVGQSPPNMNGLVDRSTAFTNALMVLEDLAAFPDVQGERRFVPEDYTRRVVP